MVAMPERDRFAAREPHGPRRVAIVQRPRKGDHTDAGAHGAGHLLRLAGGWLQTTGGQGSAGRRRMAFPMRFPRLAAAAAMAAVVVSPPPAPAPGLPPPGRHPPSGGAQHAGAAAFPGGPPVVGYPPPNAP